MKTCRNCNWRNECYHRGTGRVQSCTDWESDWKLLAIVGIMLAIILGTLMWGGFIYGILALLGAKGF